MVRGPKFLRGRAGTNPNQYSSFRSLSRCSPNPIYPYIVPVRPGGLLLSGGVGYALSNLTFLFIAPGFFPFDSLLFGLHP